MEAADTVAENAAPVQSSAPAEHQPPASPRNRSQRGGCCACTFAQLCNWLMVLSALNLLIALVEVLIIASIEILNGLCKLSALVVALRLYCRYGDHAAIQRYKCLLFCTFVVPSIFGVLVFFVSFENAQFLRLFRIVFPLLYAASVSVGFKAKREYAGREEEQGRMYALMGDPSPSAVVPANPVNVPLADRSS